jgi:hypothetical protein
MDVDVSGARVLVVADREANPQLLNRTARLPGVEVGVVAAALQTADPSLPTAGTAPEGNRLVVGFAVANFLTQSVEAMGGALTKAVLPVGPS